MHLHLLLPVCLAAMVSTFLVQPSSAQLGLEGRQSEVEKRIPYYYPLRSRLFNQELEEEEEAENGFDRKRRTPFFYANPRFWKSHKASEEDDDDDEEFERKRRIPYFYPHYRYGMKPMGLSEEEIGEEEDKRSLKKRGNPYYYPSLNYNYLPRQEDMTRKRYVDESKRSLKRSLSDALEHDDVTDFGYDKRSRFDLDNEDDKKKKRVVVKKSI